MRLIFFITWLFCLAISAHANSIGGTQSETKFARHVVLIQDLIHSGKTRRAEAILSRIIRNAPSQEIANPFVDLLAQLHRSHPFELRGNFAVLPSTNVTRAPTATEFSTLLGDLSIDDGGETQAGVGVKVGIGGTYRLPLRGGRTLLMTANATRSQYGDASLRHWIGSIKTTVVHRQPKSTFQYSGFASRTVFDINGDSPTDSADAWRYGVSTHHTSDHGVTKRSIATRLEYRGYVEQDARDGPFASASVSWAAPVFDRGTLRWGGGLERHLPDSEHQKNWGLSLDLRYSQRVTDTTRVGASMSAKLRRYDGIFPTVDFARSDDILRIGFSAADTRIRLGGAVPTLNCGYTDHRSNIALYATSYADCSMTFSFDF